MSPWAIVSLASFPCSQRILIGYRLKKTLKTRPIKKIKETDAIFAHVDEANQKPDQDPASLRLSIDCKAKVKIGNLSRGGKDRTKDSRQADDHDTEIIATLSPCGILDVGSDALSIYFGQSYETADFIVDCLELWWADHVSEYPEIEALAINFDNGPSVNSHRTQFIRRMVEFIHQNNLRIKLISYPPYHSEYNPIKRCWGTLDKIGRYTQKYILHVLSVLSIGSQRMPLLDYFHPPLYPLHHWESLNSNWATRLADVLNDCLPEDDIVEEQTHAGTHLEIDVATFEQPTDGSVTPPQQRGPAILTTPVWTPPTASHTMSAIFPNCFEVRVFQTLSPCFGSLYTCEQSSWAPVL